MVFLDDMSLLQQYALNVFHAFQNDDFVTKETSNKFNQIPDDHSFES